MACLAGVCLCCCAEGGSRLLVFFLMLMARVQNFASAYSELEGLLDCYFSSSSSLMHTYYYMTAVRRTTRNLSILWKFLQFI